jgi:hypothetical protein
MSTELVQKIPIYEFGMVENILWLHGTALGTSATMRLCEDGEGPVKLQKKKNINLQ